ncbi:MAG: hypothetical protein A2315_04435 [Ignavibacteria bacterium RIFOXYB2_FULL_35_12]|nr:MAG: hypothetical protein A2058_12935 [Ignavibacteria bacterium GWA2_36_19]OGU53875.1 MAG: hypothetical protein A2006_04410 [Ignavibacteria bacterium GWC2_35_8]OGU56621.1 MAG: hypothetical protein A2X60_05935 [Ignavibacteria bacterium GWF2_35_20]OGU81237.1 MAG: hypothetical protein A2254_12450 [Ignavibacteria bacterium RIFOXYA2_FULL_35_9]OGU87760.1 MAG: hypothetical protein A2492_12355 [Ignavibacteria bacterium RIFOXYC12_FULL_35_11]OGU87965.1 MAG: hypothetical protein A3K31_06235 [Ignavibac
MKILFLTQYFPPEVGAPQNRLYELAIRLQNKGAEITILTAMPNYPRMVLMEKYKGKFYCFENLDLLKIHRAYIFVKKSRSLFVRLLNFFSFVISSIIIGIIKIEKQDYIFCESPPLFLGISALILVKIKRAKLIFNVSDLWPESAEKLGLVNNKFLLNISKNLEEYLYKKSYIITGQTQGIINNISARFPAKKTYWLKNGVDTRLFEKISNYQWRIEKGFSTNDFLVLYAGILGYAQGLDVILYAAKILQSNSEIKFIILGDGPEKERLKKLSDDLNLKNVLFMDPELKERMPLIIKSINTSVIPLKKIDLFKGAIPSKIFEILASKKPILLGVEGEAKDLFITDGKCGLSFIPEDAEDLAKNIIELYNSPSLADISGLNGFNYVSKNFNRDSIVEEFWNVLISQKLN